MKIKLLALTILLTHVIQAQVLIGDETSTIEPSAILEIKSTERGLLPPRMTAEERDEIINPAAGLIIYCTDCLEMQMYNDTAWTNMIGLPTALPPIPTITIGSQTWMAKNLDVGVFVPWSTGQQDNSIIEKYCYNDDPANCEIYGGLYRWDEMMEYGSTPGIQGICPVGFHIPTDDEWKTLEQELNMSPADVNAWGIRGTDQGSQLGGNENLWTDGALDQDPAFGTSGFSVLPAGLLNFNYGGSSVYSSFWTSSTFNDPSEAWNRQLFHNNSGINRGWYYTYSSNSVRCIQD